MKLKRGGPFAVSKRLTLVRVFSCPVVRRERMNSNRKVGLIPRNPACFPVHFMDKFAFLDVQLCFLRDIHLSEATVPSQRESHRLAG